MLERRLDAEDQLLFRNLGYLQGIGDVVVNGLVGPDGVILENDANAAFFRGRRFF
jgi:hypothetical protein